MSSEGELLKENRDNLIAFASNDFLQYIEMRDEKESASEEIRSQTSPEHPAGEISPMLFRVKPISCGSDLHLQKARI